jgi:hypothetical protein
MATITGSGGATFEVDIPAEGTDARARFDADVASGAITVTEAPKKTPAKKAAPAVGSEG